MKFSYVRLFSQFSRRAGLFMTALAVIAVLFPPIPTQAQTCDEDFYSNNDIRFYNPCDETCSVSARSALSLRGSNNSEKIWNFFADKGLSAIAVAGIMGNFSQESGLDPAIKQNETLQAIPAEGDGVTGYGLAQWTYKARQAALFAKMNTSGLAQYYGEGWGAAEKNKEIPAADQTKLLEVQLAFAWEGDTTTISSIASQLNSATSVNGDSGSTVLFHNLYENSSDSAEQIQERVSDAEGFYRKYGSTNGLATSDAACSAAGALGGVASIDDAVAWAMKYVSDTKSEYAGRLNTSGSEIAEEKSFQGGTIRHVYNFGHRSGAYCWQAADCGQCVALSGWFARTQTKDASFLNDHGGGIVDRYADAGKPTGTEPRPWSIYSAKYGRYGHTGVVLGVLSNGEVITIEANANSAGYVSIWQGDLKKRIFGTQALQSLTFAYFDDRLAGDAAKVGN